MNYSRILVAFSLPFWLTLPACDGPFSSMGSENGGSPSGTSAGGSSTLGAGGISSGGVGSPGGEGSGGACPAMPALWPVCTSGAAPVAQYDARGCQTGYVCPESPNFCACAGDIAKVPSQICADGTTSGNLCVTNDDGTCEWLTRGCPTEGAGGAGPGSSPPSIGGCVYNGVSVAVGASVKSNDGCNTCYCDTAMGLACTTMACAGAGGAPSTGTSTSGFAGAAGSGTSPTTCSYNGRLYAVGISFQSADGCNTCSCTSGGLVACTLMACGGAGGTSSGTASSSAPSTSVCPPIPAITPTCTTGSPVMQYDVTGCALGYACP